MEQAPPTDRLLIPVSARDHIRGNPDAPIALLEYGDYECPYCGKAHPIVQELRERLGERMRFAFRHFPRNSIHPHSGYAAQAAEAAGAQGKFWEMHDEIYAHQADLEPDDIHRYALRIGLEIYKFESDLSSERFAPRVGDDYEGAVKNAIRKTPTFFINAVRHAGPMEVEALLSALESAGRSARGS